MKAGEMFKGYQDMRQECIVLEFQIQQFEGISHEDVIESMTYSNPQEEKVQTSRLSDRTGKTAIRYRRVKERLDDDWYDSLLSRYQYLQEEIKNVAVAAWEAIKSAVISIMEAIKSAITAAWEAIKSAVSSVVNAIKEVITSVWNAIKSTVASIVGGLKDAVVNVFNSLLSGIKNAIQSLLPWCRSLPLFWRDCKWKKKKAGKPSCGSF